MKFLITLLSVCLLFATVQAQTAEFKLPDSKCWVGSLSFTPGSTARASDQVMVCTEGGKWEETDKGASVCIHNGKAFSVSSVTKVSSSKLALRCTSDGTWEEFEAPKK